jgi:SNF2 family DNA or RNA helicase
MWVVGRRPVQCSDVGSGKTASMLFLCKVGRKGRKEEEKTMIVTPDSILFQWAEEIRKFTPEMKYCVFENPSQINLDLAKNVDIVLVSRQTLTNDNQHRLSKIPFKRIILD